MTIPNGATYSVTDVPAGLAFLALPGGSFVVSAASNATTGSKSVKWLLSNGEAGSKTVTVI